MDALPNAVAVLMGLFAPVVIQFLKQKISSKNARFYLAIGLSAVIGVISAFVANTPFDAANISMWVGAVLGFGQVAYNTWKVLFK